MCLLRFRGLCDSASRFLARVVMSAANPRPTVGCVWMFLKSVKNSLFIGESEKGDQRHNRNRLCNSSCTWSTYCVPKGCHGKVIEIAKLRALDRSVQDYYFRRFRDQADERMDGWYRRHTHTSLLSAVIHFLGRSRRRMDGWYRRHAHTSLLSAVVRLLGRALEREHKEHGTIQLVRGRRDVVYAEMRGGTAS